MYIWLGKKTSLSFNLSRYLMHFSTYYLEFPSEPAHMGITYKSSINHRNKIQYFLTTVPRLQRLRHPGLPKILSMGSVANLRRQFRSLLYQSASP
jgi:hypothetical protein